MSDRAVQAELREALPHYELLTFALQGRMVLVLDGDRVAGEQRTRVERGDLMNWLI